MNNKDIKKLARAIQIDRKAINHDRILNAAEKALKEASQIAPGKNYAKLAIAAGLIIAAIMTAAIFLNRPEPKGRQIVQPDTEQIELTAQGKQLLAQLEKINTLYAENNITDLTEMLQTAQQEAKIAAANQLAKIGDQSAIPALKNLSEKWIGDLLDNPFAKAIDSITQRTEPVPDNTPVPQEPQNTPIYADPNTLTDIHFKHVGHALDGKVEIGQELWFKKPNYWCRKDTNRTSV